MSPGDSKRDHDKEEGSRAIKLFWKIIHTTTTALKDFKASFMDSPAGNNLQFHSTRKRGKFWNFLCGSCDDKIKRLWDIWSREASALETSRIRFPVSLLPFLSLSFFLRNESSIHHGQTYIWGKVMEEWRILFQWNCVELPFLSSRLSVSTLLELKLLFLLVLCLTLFCQHFVWQEQHKRGDFSIHSLTFTYLSQLKF